MNVLVKRNKIVRWRNWLDANKVRSQLECRNTFMYPKMISYRFESCPDHKGFPSLPNKRDDASERRGTQSGGGIGKRTRRLIYST